MPNNTANAQFTIMDYTDGISLITGIGANKPLTQQYDDASGKLVPSWDPTEQGGSTLTLTPRAVKAGTSDNVFTGEHTTSIVWYRRYNGESNWTTLTNTGTETWVTTTGPTKGVLSVSENKIFGHDQVEYRVTANYYDSTLQLTFPLEMVITFSKVNNGTSYVLAVVETPRGTQIINHSPATLLLVPEIIRGATVDRSNDDYVWQKSTDGVNWTTISNTPNVYEIDTTVGSEHKGEVIVYPDGISGGFTMFKVFITENDPSHPESYHQTFESDPVSLHDFDDPLISTIESTAGNFFKNGVGTTKLIARVYHGAAGEVDPTGTIYYYTWTKTNADGSPDTTFNAHPENWWSTYGSGSGAITNQRGKCIEIDGDDVTIKATFFCNVTELNPNA